MGPEAVSTGVNPGQYPAAEAPRPAFCDSLHNLYYVTSSGWDHEVLGGLMLSDVTNLFIGAYCVKMRGGTYRFQAQYLRRIRVPGPSSIRAADRRALTAAFERRDVEAATGVAARVYGIDASLLATERRAEVA